MRNLLIYISALSSLSPSFGFRHGSAQLRDLLAFPKYEVQFLNHLPLAETDAERCQSLGIESEDEWLGPHAPRLDRRRLGDGSEDVPSVDRLELVRMALKSPQSNETSPYLCLMPSPATLAAQAEQAAHSEHEEGINPAQSWLALSHLDGKCLYARQGWFTYAYCHNSHLRQFRAAPHTHPHPPGGYVPEEDTNFDAYTLGQANPAPRKARSSLPQGKSRSKAKRPANPPGSPDSVDGALSGHTSLDRPNQGAPAVSSNGGANRYLVQKWSDGTRCDKTGRPRETEIQIHCSMTAHDQIYLVKEMAICQYVVIIHSPYLCSLPGFRPEKLDVDSAPIRCRQVMKDAEYDEWHRSSPGSDAAGLSGGEPTSPSLRPPGLEPKAVKIPVAAGLPDGPSLRDLLKKALDAKSAQSGGTTSPPQGLDEASADEGENEVVFISWEEDEHGNQAMVLDASSILSEALGEVGDDGSVRAKGEMKDNERKMIREAVKHFLEKKGLGEWRGKISSGAGDDIGEVGVEGDDESQGQHEQGGALAVRDEL